MKIQAGIRPYFFFKSKIAVIVLTVWP